MANIKTVTLTSPLKGPRGQVTAFKFKEPTCEIYFDLGDPRMPMQRGDTIVWQVMPDVVRQYAERLLTEDGDPNIMAGASLRDAKEIEKVILGFFREAESQTTTSA
jgi:hypothetical protein